MKKFKRTSGVFAALALSVGGCSVAADDEAAPAVEDKSDQTLADAIDGDNSVSEFALLVERTGVAGALEGNANYTLFAPTNSTVEELGEDSLATLSDEDNGAIAGAFVREHMASGSLTLDAIRQAIEANNGEVTAKTLGNGILTFAMQGDTVTVSTDSGSTANLTGASISASNGTILLVDAVLTDADAL